MPKKEFKLNKLEEQLIKNLTESINNASGENWKRDWVVPSMAINGMTGKSFSGKTELLLFFVQNNKEFKDKGNRWFTYGAVNKENLWKKQEVGHFEKTPVFAYSESPCFTVHYKDGTLDEKGHEKLKTFAWTKDEEYSIIWQSQIHKVKEILEKQGIKEFELNCCGSKITPLYHESQLDQKALEKIKTPEARKIKTLENINVDDIKKIGSALNLKGITFDDEKSGFSAFYLPTKDEIFLPSVSSFKSKEGLYSTAFHELTHSTGHQSRLNREIQNSFGKENYAKEELVAEIGSLFLCNEMGIDSSKQLQNHGEYLKAWLETFAKDKEKQAKEIFSAISKGVKAKEFIIEKLQEYEKTHEHIEEKPLEEKDSKILYGREKFSEGKLENGNPFSLLKSKEFGDKALIMVSETSKVNDKQEALKEVGLINANTKNISRAVLTPQLDEKFIDNFEKETHDLLKNKFKENEKMTLNNNKEKEASKGRDIN